MKIWIDVLTPKQVNFFAPLYARLARKGHRVFLTTRKYREANELLEMQGLDALTIGQHGGADLSEKLISSAKRVVSLISFAQKTKPNICISFASPEAARVAFGMGIPHLCASDSPHAESVSRLTIPLSTKLFTPSVIPVAAWTKYGILRRDIVRYGALDPVVWLRNFKPNKRILDELGLDDSLDIVTLRSTEYRAAYLNRTGFDADLMSSISTALARALPDLQIVLLARYDSARILKKIVPKQVVVPSSIIDSSSLLFNSDLFIGGGGTMTAEAALLGVFSLSCYPSNPTFVDKYLVNQGLVKRETTVSGIIRSAVLCLSRKDENDRRRMKARKLLLEMDDPLACVERSIAQLE